MDYCVCSRFVITLITAAMVPAIGCSRSEAPKALRPELLPSIVENAFKDAVPEAKTAATEIIISLRTNNDVKAFFELQELSSRPDLTLAQREATARSMLSLNERLRTAAADGNQQAAEALQIYQSGK
jgi:hypothetical protein